jgi:hypothetical protein
VQAHDRVLAEVEVLGPQVGDFLCAGAGVVEEQDQGAVPQRERAAAGQVVQEVFDRRGALTMWIPLVGLEVDPPFDDLHFPVVSV